MIEFYWVDPKYTRNTFNDCKYISACSFWKFCDSSAWDLGGKRFITSRGLCLNWWWDAGDLNAKLNDYKTFKKNVKCPTNFKYSGLMWFAIGHDQWLVSCQLPFEQNQFFWDRLSGKCTVPGANTSDNIPNWAYKACQLAILWDRKYSMKATPALALDT